MNEIFGSCQTKHWISISDRCISELTEYPARPEHMYICIYMYFLLFTLRYFLIKCAKFFFGENSQVCPNIVHQSNLSERENLLKGKTGYFTLHASLNFKPKVIVKSF